MPKQLVRFSFSITQGPSAGVRCAGWRVWCKGEDTYITSKSLDGKWKTSLHGDVAWRTAATQENMRSDQPVLPADHDRAAWKHQPTPFMDGVRLAFVVGATRAALRMAPADAREIDVECLDQWNSIQLVKVWMAEVGVSPAPKALIGKIMTLTSGRTVWLEAANQVVPEWSATPRTPAWGVVARPLDPKTHDVSAPGILLTGVDLNTRDLSEKLTDVDAGPPA